MRLYHIHRSNSSDQLFYPGNEINVGSDYNYLHLHYLNRSLTIDEDKEEEGIIKTYKRNVLDFLTEEAISQMTPEERKDLLYKLHSMIHNIELDRREEILEEVRRKHYPTRPSRYKCMWLTNAESIETWLKFVTLKDSIYQVFEVEVDGNLFKSCDGLLPQGYYDPEYAMELAHKYWNPVPDYLSGRDDIEYLFEGNAKIIERVR
ncbi:MAG: DUF2441 domain-containing protein [Bacilli bacterium]|nr:DUF2441 domain-containing protein [Bacilli bacterium]